MSNPSHKVDPNDLSDDEFKQSMTESFNAAPSLARQQAKVLAETAYPTSNSGLNESPSGPIPIGIKPSRLLQYNTDNDSRCLLGKRWICEGGSALWIGQAGLGKSSMMLQAMTLWGLGEPFFGIAPTKALKQIAIQAENDEGDLSEQLKGVLNGLNLSARAPELDLMLTFFTESSKTKDDFAKYLRMLVAEYKPDLIWLDPLLAFVGGDISSQETCSYFLRNLLTPIAQQYNAAFMVIHHTGKPPRDTSARNSYVGGDYSYLGIGSSELANWARAIVVLRETTENNYELRLAKRWERAGLLDSMNCEQKTIALKHADKGICWEYGVSVIAESTRVDEMADQVIDLMQPDMVYKTGWIVHELEQLTGKKRPTIFRPTSFEFKILERIRQLCTQPQAPSVFIKRVKSNDQK